MHHHNVYAVRLFLLISIVLLPSGLPNGLPNGLFAQQIELVPAESSTVRYVVPGPVHEALVPLAQASQVAEIIPEPPPAEAPGIDRPPQDSRDSLWVDGYWNWHAKQRHYTWIPGCWRRAPADLRWQPGSWAPAPDGVVRYPGYWYDVHRKPQFVRRAPPADQGREPTQKMMGEGYVWIRGCWTVDDDQQYEWQPGYVAREEAGYLWQPATVVPAAGGFAVVEGYWDFPVAQRGTAFAAMQPPIPSAAGLRAIDRLSIERTLGGKWAYFRLLQPAVAASNDEQPRIALPTRPPLVSERGLLVDGKATLTGIVRKGDLTPHYIDVKLVGGTARVAETNDEGRFEFTDIPYGRYLILAEGPVQNYHRSGAVSIDIEQPTAQVEIELE